MGGHWSWTPDFNVHVYIFVVFSSLDQIFDKSSLRNEVLILIAGSTIWERDLKVMMAGAWGSCSHCIHNQKAETGVCGCSVRFVYIWLGDLYPLYSFQVPGALCFHQILEWAFPTRKIHSLIDMPKICFHGDSISRQIHDQNSPGVMQIILESYLIISVFTERHGAWES